MDKTIGVVPYSLLPTPTPDSLLLTSGNPMITGRESLAKSAEASGNVSRGLEWLWHYLHDIPHPRILDCGPVRQSTVSILMHRGVKLYVADLLTPLQKEAPQLWDRSQKTPQFRLEAFLEQVPPIPPASLTAVFCWQVPDLAPRAALPGFMARVLSYLEPGGVFFCLLHEPRLPEGAGATWWLESLTTLGSRCPDNRPFPHPPITNREMERLNPGGSVKTFLTRSGLREVLALK
ncbi:MAG: hypothetical protein ACLQOO_27910 [Terriglobia bacterium]